MDTESVLMNQNRGFQLNNEGIEKTLNQQVTGSIPVSPIQKCFWVRADKIVHLFSQCLQIASEMSFGSLLVELKSLLGYNMFVSEDMEVSTALE